MRLLRTLSKKEVRYEVSKIPLHFINHNSGFFYYFVAFPFGILHRRPHLLTLHSVRLIFTNVCLYNFSEVNDMSELHPYQDRKKLKWNGFFLSEHTATIAKQRKQAAVVIKPKEKLTEEEIGAVLSEAAIKNKRIAVQLDIVIADSYLPDICGMIQGYDESTIYVGGEKIKLSEIRNVEFESVAKWSDLEA